VESPRWHDGRLWFADWIAGEIVAVDSAGQAEVMVRHESPPLFFDFRDDGTPLIVSGPLQALVRPSPDGPFATYADLSDLSSHGYNEIVVDGRGPTGSAAMPTPQSGTPRYRTGTVFGSGKAAKSYKPSTWTRVRTPACSAVISSPRCSSQPPTGQA
jgi:sugar lactone lactonase YvrE